MDEISEMSDSDFKLFQKYIYENAGISLSDKKKTLLSNRLRKRLVLHNLNSFKKYYDFVLHGDDTGAEIVEMINAVTTNVTEFFRNPKQFDMFRDKVMPLVLDENSSRKSLKILSAGCSTGEEPYTIAISLLENFRERLKGWQILIEACDLSTNVVKKAEEGIYKKDKMSGLTDRQISGFFKPCGTDEFQAADELKKLIRYRKFNLKSDEFSVKYDIVFCRNVVIYFDRETKSRIYQKFYDALVENGFFLVGYSEGIINDNRFKYFSPGIYRKNSQEKI